MNNNGSGLIRVAIYARVSTQEQALEGTSLEFQDSQLAAFCQLQGWTIINSYVDPGFSGKDGNRPGCLLQNRIGRNCKQNSPLLQREFLTNAKKLLKAPDPNNISL